ncbi:glycosyltransferase family 2 protein [Nostoc sp.]|uniref:glycosyltransferase family 2 protein n=1 Tax=Nostoc sp. TaxID=1180 RepID=UPI002FF75B36
MGKEQKYIEMKITCSILCYNYGRYLAQAIDSCLNQELGDYQLEVLVIDDGSTDETPEVCQNYQNRIRVLHSPNQGFGASLDKAIHEASGDYVCLLDADDYFSSNKILTLLPWIISGYLYIENNTYYIDPNGKAIDFSTHAGGNTSTLCLNRVAALSLIPVQNEIFFHPLKSAGHGINIDKALTFYRVHTSSMMGSKSADVWYSHLAKVKHNLADKLLLMSQQPPSWTNSSDLKKISKDYQSHAYYDEMEAALQLGQRSKALLRCVKIFLAAILSRNGLTIWHCKVIIRGLLARPLVFNRDSYSRHKIICLFLAIIGS